MGVEANITIRQLIGGQLPKEAPYFTVKEPVIVVPLHRVDLGRWVNLACSDDDFQNTLRFGFIETQIVPLINKGDRFPVFGIALIPFQAATHWVAQWTQRGEGPGSERLETLLQTWKSITPGIWCVTEYRESGMGDSDGSFFFRTDEAMFGPPIEWEIWT